jgi:hypothetical protein
MKRKLIEDSKEKKNKPFGNRLLRSKKFVEPELETNLEMNIDLLDPSVVFSKEVLHLVNDITYFDVKET